jgi:hypothetical protein
MTDLRPQRRQILKGAGAMAATAALLSPTAALAKTTKASQGIVGSWLATVTAPSLNLKALLTFHQDGTLVESTQGDDAPPDLSTPGYGAWVNTGSDEVAMTFIHLFYDTKGNLIAFVKHHETMQPDGDTYTAKGKYVGTDPSGKVLFSGSYTVHATRIKVEGA